MLYRIDRRIKEKDQQTVTAQSAASDTLYYGR
jgi:hypothetical protein